MPHTTRHRSKPTFKHQYLTTSDGWTHVFRGTSAQKLAPRPPSIPVLSPTEIPSGANLAKVQETYTKCLRQWRESEWCAKLVRILGTDVIPGVIGEGEEIEGKGVDSCVVLGLGSLSGGDSREHSWWQLVALQTILEELGMHLPRGAVTIPRRLMEAMLGSRHAITTVVFQDPRFNLLDEEFLASLSFTVVKDSQAFSSVDPTTFLYIPHGELELTGRALEGKGPALYIGNDLDMWIESPTVPMEKKSTIMPWREKSVSVTFPQPEASTWGNNTRIYWKRPSVNGAANEWE